MADNIIWPLTFNRIRRGALNHTFGMVRRYANGRPKPHQGWDFEATIGTPTYAIADGQVVFVREHGDYGKQLCMSFRHGGETLYAFYAHLHSIFVGEGAVKLGQKVATTGESGNARGMPVEDQHLHFEIRERAWCGAGLTHRRSPMTIYGECPLRNAVIQITARAPR